MGISELLILVLFFGAIYGAYRLAKPRRFLIEPSPPADTNNSGFAGVRGWLSLLIVWLLFLRPLSEIGHLNLEITLTERQFQNLNGLEVWSTVKTVSWCFVLIFSCLSFYAGFGLASRRDVSAVRRAKYLLWVTGPVAFLVMRAFIPLVFLEKVQSDPKLSDPQLLGAFMVSVIITSIWTVYLSKSKRVKATYCTI